MKKLLFSAVALCLLGATPLIAADRPIYKAPPPPPPPIFNWTGFYVGIDAGYLWSSYDLSLPGSPAAGIASPDPDSFTAGGHIGYRFQFPNGFVFGIEGDIGWLNASATGAFSGAPAAGTFARLKWDASARGTVGWAVNRTLVYFTGGASWLHTNGCGVLMVAPTTCVGGTTFSGTLDGWVIGGGIAFAFTDNLIFRIEYLHADYGTTSFVTPGFVGGTANVAVTTDKVRGGLSWKF